MTGLVGCNVLVGGASSGIGQAIAIRLPQEGADVTINYPKDLRKAQETAREAVDRRHAHLRGFDIRTAWSPE